MSTACGRPQGGSGSCGQGEGNKKSDFFVDVINGWPLTLRLTRAIETPMNSNKFTEFDMKN